MIIYSIFLLVILKVCFCCDDPNQLSFLEPFKDVRNIQTTKGEDLNIVCCHRDGVENLSWRDKNNDVIVYKNNNGVFSLKDEKNRLILRLNNIDSTKMGKYTCINTVKSLFKSVIISLRDSLLKPDIIKKNLDFPNNKPIVINSSLNINQVIKSWIFTRGKKNIVVNKDGKGKGYSVSEDKKVFTILTGEKSGDIKVVWCQYQEVSSNGDVKTGLFEYTWTLYDPIDVQLILDHKGPILESNDVKLICTFRYNEISVVSFPHNFILKQNMVINDDNLNNGKVIFTINKITKDSEGEYECKISKILSSDPFKAVEESAKIRVDVILPPKIISNDFVTSSAKLNDDAYLSCQIKSKELLKEDVFFEHYLRESSSWKKLTQNDEKYGVNLTESEINILTLLIKKVSWEDRGKYRCVAKNAAGEDSKIGQFTVEKAPELNSSVTLIHMATKPVRIECSVIGYPVSSSEDIVELRMVNQSPSFDLNIITKKIDDFDGITVVYEVVYKGELTEGSSYKLECYYTNMKTNAVQQKDIELKIAQKPSVPVVNVVCSGSSGIVFKYQIILSEDKNKKMVKNVLSYAPSEEYDSMSMKPSKVVLIKEDEKNEFMIYVVKDLMASRKYTFKWESFNLFGLSNERTLTYSTKDVMPPQIPKKLQFSTKDNKINVNVNWDDECPYTGSNSAIKDIVVSLKPVKDDEGKNNWQWIEKNFTLDTDKSSAQFQIFLTNAQIDYEIEVALRSPQGTSDSIKSIYKADIVLAGSLFSCFPRCTGNYLLSDFGLVQFILTLVSMILLRWYN